MDMTDIGGDVRRAVRLLWRRPAFAAAAIGTLALGAAIAIAVTSIAEAILLRPLPWANAERIVAIQEHDRARQSSTTSWADFLELSATLRSYAAVAAYSGGSRTLSGMGPAERLPAIEITPRFFDVLGAGPALGRSFTDADAVPGAAPVVILSDRAWRRRFAADRAVIGRPVVLSGVPFTIVGVLPESFVFPPRADPDLWLPLRPSAAQASRPYLHFLDVIARRHADVSTAAAADELRSRSQAWQHSGHEWHASTTLGMVRLRDDMVAGVRPALLVLVGAALLVLLASAASVSGLLLARLAGRGRELGIRAALGASLSRRMRQLAIEALSIAIPGAAVGVLLGSWSVAVLAASIPARFRATLPFADTLSVTPAAAIVSVAAIILAVLAAGLLPALRAASAPIGASLASGARTTAGRSEIRLRRFFVAAQIALAAVLLSGAALIGRSVLNLSRVSPGFAIDGLVAGRVSLPDAPRYQGREQIAAAAERVVDRVRAVPGVLGAEAINQLPLSGRGNTGGFSIAGTAMPGSPDALIRDVTPGYFSLMGIPLVEGRTLLPTDTLTSTRVVVVNRLLARQVFGDRSPIGERIVFEFFTGRPAWTIVGVAGDEQFDSVDRPMAPVVYFPFAQDPESAFSIVFRAAAPEAVMPSIREAIASVDAGLPLYGVQTLKQAMAASPAVFLRSLVMRLLAWFSIAALLLGAVGVYGVLSESVHARAQELGIRQALGATRADIACLAVGTGLTPALIGGACGLAIAAVAAPAARSLLFGVAPLDVPSLVMVGLVIAVAALAACLVPARRAMTLPPSVALRQD